MELSSDNLFTFVFRKFKQIKKKNNKQTESPRLQITLKQNSPKKEDNKINNSEIIEYFHALIINDSNISNILYNSIDPLIKECFNNLEYLSITNNFIRNLDFIINLPNLFYLDLFGNPLEELTALNNKNIFGYLRLSVESFNEKKLLNIFNLQCGIFEMDIKDKVILRIFNNNNHHICMVNNEVNYLIDKIKYEEFRAHKRKLSKKNKNMNSLSLRSSLSSNMGEISFSDNKNEKNNIQFGNIINLKMLQEENGHIVENPIKNIVQKNPFLVKIKYFFDDFQSVIYKILQNDYFDYSSTKKIILSENEIFSSKNYINNQKYLEHEKEKLILLFDIYKKLSVFNKDKADNKYYIGNIYSINVNEIMDSIFIKEIKVKIMNHSQIPLASIIILISIIFYTIGTISDKMLNALINYILTKYYQYDENKKYPDFSNLGDIHYLTFYYSTYDYIYKRMIDNKNNISIDKYKDILNILQMEKLIVKSNYLYKKLKENKSKDNNIEFIQNKKIKINNEIKAVKELNIIQEFLVLIEFLCDFIIYEKIEDIIINNSYPGEYSFFIELKETIEETAFQIDNNNFLTSTSLSTLKFQKNKKERLFNKFYFEKDKIKRLKLIDFNNNDLYDFTNNKTLNNSSISIDNNILFNSSNFNNIKKFEQNNEYNKKDDIVINEFFSITNKPKTNINRLYKNKIQYNFFPNKLKEKEKVKENTHEYEDDNNENNLSLIKLPKLERRNFNQQSYEEFDFLKKIIFDPSFLSQHARNAIKFEKNKKLQNLKNIDNNNYRNNNKNDRTINRTEDLKFNGKGGINKYIDKKNYSSKNSRNNLNKTKTELKNEISSKDNLNSKTYKSILNSTNKDIKANKYKLLNDVNSSDKKLKTNINNESENKTKVTFKEVNDDLIIKCNKIRNQYKSPFVEIPESFPGITLLNFGLTKKKLPLKKIKFNGKKSPNKNNGNKKLSHKEIVINNIKQTVKDNILRNARRVAYPIYQSYI